MVRALTVAVGYLILGCRLASVAATHRFMMVQGENTAGKKTKKKTTAAAAAVAATDEQQKDYTFEVDYLAMGGSLAEWLAYWTQAQKGPGSNRGCDAVG